jgi:hypothetical protein
LDICFWTGVWDFSGFVNENLTFSLELNGVFGPDAVDGVCGAKTNNQSLIIINYQISIYLMLWYYFYL